MWAEIKRHFRLIGLAVRRLFVDDGMVHAGNMSFLGMLSLFPFLLFLVTLSGFFGQTQAGLDAIGFAMENMPPDVAAPLQEAIGGIIVNARGDILTFSILIALWTSASGVEAARSAVLRAYGAEYRKAFWLHRLESFAVVIVTALLAFLSMSFLVLGPAIIEGFNALVTLPDVIWKAWGWVRYGVSPLVLFIAIYGLFMALSPWRAIHRRFRAPGAFAVVLIWMATAGGLSLYLRHFGNYDVTYGSLAGIVIAQLFFFIVSIGFIFGAELNAAYSRHHQPDENITE